jgi:hypothetical protein
MNSKKTKWYHHAPSNYIHLTRVYKDHLKQCKNPSPPSSPKTSHMYSEIEFYFTYDMTTQTLSFAIDDYFTILKLISSIKTNDKLRIIQEKDTPNRRKLEIDTRSFPQFSRWWTQDNRNDTIQFLDEFFQHLLFYITQHMSCSSIENELVEEKEKEKTFIYEQEKNNIHWLLHHLELSIQGLYHLKTTYQHDFQIQSKLEMMIQHIQLHIQKRKEQFVLQKISV